MSAPRSVVFLVPDGIDDDARVSGGNVYDRRIRDGLRGRDWDLRMIPVATGDVASAAPDLAAALAFLPENSVVLVDGLLTLWGARPLETHADRLHIVVLAHMPFAGLDFAERVLTTSTWTRGRLLESRAAREDRIVVAYPGTEIVPRPVREPGASLLCVGPIAGHKGQDLVVDALVAVRDLDGWTCTFAGSTATEPGLVTPRKNERIQNVPRHTESPIWGRMRATRVSVSPHPLNSW